MMWMDYVSDVNVFRIIRNIMVTFVSWAAKNVNHPRKV